MAGLNAYCDELAAADIVAIQLAEVTDSDSLCHEELRVIDKRSLIGSISSKCCACRPDLWFCLQ
jgi:hypothetical protein